MDILMNGDGWVMFCFSDGTVQTVHTSLNAGILGRYGVTVKENHFFDLDRLRYVPFRMDAESVEVLSEKPEFDSEVLQFACRFI